MHVKSTQRGQSLGAAKWFDVDESNTTTSSVVSRVILHDYVKGNPTIIILHPAQPNSRSNLASKKTVWFGWTITK